MLKSLWIPGGLLVAVSGFTIGFPGSATSLATHTISAAQEEDADPTTAKEPQIVLWNEDHCVVTDLSGEWDVRDTLLGTRLRPLDDGCRIRVFSAAEGLEHAFSVPTAGEVYIALGWICVNQVHQESWTSAGDGPIAEIPCGEDPSECTLSYPRDYVSSITFSASACWVSAVEPPGGCAFKTACKAGSGGCEVSIQLTDGSTDTLVSSCGSGASVQQCADSAGTIWICYCE